MSNIKGDVAVFHDNPNATRSSVVNSYSDSQLMTIYPDDGLIKKDQPEKEWQFHFYWPSKSQHSQLELSRLKFQGQYDFVRREEWQIARDMVQWGEDGILEIAGHKIMYRPAEIWRKERAERIARANGQVRQEATDFEAKNRRKGAEVETFFGVNEDEVPTRRSKR